MLSCAVCGEQTTRVVAGFSLCFIHSEALSQHLMDTEGLANVNVWFVAQRRARGHDGDDVPLRGGLRW